MYWLSTTHPQSPPALVVRESLEKRESSRLLHPCFESQDRLSDRDILAKAAVEIKDDSNSLVDEEWSEEMEEK